MAKPTSAILPIENGKLITNLDCNNLQLLNLDESNLSGGGGGGGGNDTGTTTAILRGDGAHGFADAVADVDYASPDSVALKEDITTHDTDIDTLTTSISDLTTVVGTKATSAALTAGLALKADLTSFNAYVVSNDAAVALKANSSDMTTALAAKADASALTSGLAGKEPTLPTTGTDSWILARHNAGAGSAWFFVDPLTLGTTSQSFADGVENSSTTFTSATANFVANDVGKAITGTNIPAGTVIATRNSSTSILLSQAATATASGIPFTIVNRVEIGGTGTVTSVDVSAATPSSPTAIGALFSVGVVNPTTSPTIQFGIASNIAANTFYGNFSGFTGAAGFGNAATARASLGGTTVGQALFMLTNPGAISYARINADNTVTARTPAQTLTDLGSESALTFTAPLARSTNTISIPAATNVSNGYLTFTDWNTFNAKLSSARAVNTVGPLTGGGALTADLTLSMPAATDSVAGYLTSADHFAFVNKPPNTRTISTTLPLTGGGDLSANRTFAIPKATAAVDGYLAATDFTNFAAGSGTATLVGTSGTITINNTTPPITRIVIGSALTGDMTINLPLASGYGATLNYPYLEIVDIVPGGAQVSTFRITLARTGSELIVDGSNPAAVSILMPKGQQYLRLNSNGSLAAGRWITTKYFVESFRDPTDPTKQVRVAVDLQPQNANYTFRPSRVGDSVSLTLPTEGFPVNEWIQSIGSDGSVTTTQPTASDILPVQYNSPSGTGTVTISNDGSITVVKNSVAVTGSSRTFVFPDAFKYDSGETVRFYDATGTVGISNFVRVISDPSYTGGGNTFNGQASIDITEPFFNRSFIADPSTSPPTWTASTFGGTTGSGLSLDTWHSVSPVAGVATLTCNGNVAENHHIVNMSGNITLVMSGTIPIGSIGKIKFRDSTGAHTVTVPNQQGKTPTTSGVGLFTTSTGSSVEDEYGWDYDGQFFNYYPLGLKMIAAAAPTYSTIADNTNALGATSGTHIVGDASNQNKNKAFRLVAMGGASPITDGSSYTIGKIEMLAAKLGAPTSTIQLQIFTDVNFVPSSTPVPGSTASTAKDESAFTTSETLISFNPVATLVGPRNQTNITLTANGVNQDITGAPGSFLPGDVGKLVVVFGGTGTLNNGSMIQSVAAGGATATLNRVVLTSGTATVAIQSVYWIVVSSSTVNDALNNYLFSFRTLSPNAGVAVTTPPAAIVNVAWRSQTFGSWGGLGNGPQAKYITYK